MTLEEREVFDQSDSEFQETVRKELTRARNEIRLFVEEYWKGFLETNALRGPGPALELTNHFNELVQRNAIELGEGGPRSLAMVEAERDRLLQEYDRDPDAQKRRLGVVIPTQAPAPLQRGRQPMPLGELAVRTAVRATVWTVVRDAIHAILR